MMKVKLTRKREIYGRTYPKRAVVDVPRAFGERLIYIGDAEKGSGKQSDPIKRELPRTTPKYDLLKENGLETIEDVEDADLTKIKGIGEATEKLIKDHFG
jgi:hypothetical protein